MKKKISLSAIGIILSLSVSAQTTKRALFLGNSYTYVNNLPQVIANVANSMSDTVLFDSNTPGGYTLQGHSTNTTSLNKIMLGNWDYVVLQEQSQYPSFPDTQVETDVFPYAHKLDSIINEYNLCGQTMFYMTWGRKNGDASNCASWPPVCTYTGMDSLLHLRYMMMTDSNNAGVSPVGAVWKYIRQNYPLIELYQTDESHPSEAGTYAAACCFYTAMFRKDPSLITYNFTLPATDAQNIRMAVKTVVYNNLLGWRLKANFSYFSSTGNIVTFENLSSDAPSYNWSFGDGSTTTTTNPVHTFATSGNYTVTLIANYCTYSDTITQVINISSSMGINDNVIENSIKLYPNPFSSQTILQTDHLLRNATLTVYNCFGQTVKEIKNIEGKSVVFSRDNLLSGLYFISMTEDNKTFYLNKLVITD